MNQNELKGNEQSPFFNVALAVVAGPLVIIYGLLLLFLIINGVSGSSKWLSDYWKRFGRAPILAALTLGLALWIMALQRLI